MNFSQQIAKMDCVLRVKENYDLIKRPITIGGYRGVMYMVDGFVKDEVMEKIMEFLMSADAKEVKKLKGAQAFADRYISYVETGMTADLDKLITAVLSGTLVLLTELYSEGFLIDVRTYPSRGVEEPEDDRVLRGSHDGFCETMVMNTALIRRRIRDPHLTMQMHVIGQHSKTDVAVSFMEDRVDRSFLKKLADIIDNLEVGSLTMAQESLNEALIKKGWYNPFPKIRYTERPDAAAASILEGKIVVVVDNSPTVMILPCSIFDFIQDTNDYYFPPVVGTYLRWVRILIFVATIFLTPVWYLLVRHPDSIPGWLSFIKIDEPAQLPVLAQLLIFEFVIDGLKLASLNTPSSLSNSFSVVGALILGEFAVSAGWFSPDVILYMAFVAIGNFTQPSFELGYAFKLVRILLLVLIALFDIWGLIGGILILVVLLATNKTVSGRGYLYPVIPFNGRALGNLLVRRKKGRQNQPHS